MRTPTAAPRAAPTAHRFSNSPARWPDAWCSSFVVAEAEMEFAAMFPEFQRGENLVGARKAPVELDDHTRLVYMPHTYGPAVRPMPYMESEDFPENTQQVAA